MKILIKQIYKTVITNLYLYICPFTPKINKAEYNFINNIKFCLKKKKIKKKILLNHLFKL
ncbi:hypothetical protein PFAG_03221 [Plasmodium falciparum Santa Lucia]|uniref:Uncharacterized protein n=7 Tax=Plasmodium falciparum TaxID=5833 RepID=W7K5L6_PLAFO|nr:hypothetical protein PFTANZ_03262 [Plasmodium falciparum Tanzania (2000708)]ETW41887.1 hypothetical protein PFNF135_03386 [Plasmodium falciparum NF135/5.C10]ETW52757.1 hypothetical protein PFUGPA_05064 [Plasmodium falciparum Palo Alto/Uganda]EUR70068.1 hypothetical protein PFBG_03298 [Plasmodium falciparum 7G8]EUT84129.1 hypothetical protein PFAG_03221 [Plasmodium falciparum Santa Lucia]EWC76034.1 hypothetical protein C923_03318 [Plasmodium falciparum UGT5.1]EWC88175.1 hypothetical protein